MLRVAQKVQRATFSGLRVVIYVQRVELLVQRVAVYTVRPHRPWIRHRRQSATRQRTDTTHWRQSLDAESTVGDEVTGQLADTPTRGLPTRGLDKSRTGQLAISQMPPKRKTKHAKVAGGIRELSSLRLVQYASCLVREMSSPRVVQSASSQSASWRIRELSSNRRRQQRRRLHDTEEQHWHAAESVLQTRVQHESADYCW